MAARKFEAKELVLATHNKGKLAEIAFMFRDHAITFLSAAEFNLESPEETESTFVGNALIKARYVAQHTGKCALADDSGFCVEALDGAPGVYTAEWEADANGIRTKETARQRIEEALGDHPNRNASMVSVLALCWPDGHCEIAEGVIHGKIVFPPRGENGFGQDFIFTPENETKTFAEMTREEKAQYSHRARSFEQMIKRCF